VRNTEDIYSVPQLSVAERYCLIAIILSCQVFSLGAACQRPMARNISSNAVTSCSIAAAVSPFIAASSYLLIAIRYQVGREPTMNGEPYGQR
jgi:hypothetical protein